MKEMHVSVVRDGENLNEIIKKIYTDHQEKSDQSAYIIVSEKGQLQNVAEAVRQYEYKVNKNRRAKNRRRAEREAKRFLSGLGIPGYISGYEFLKDAIVMAIMNPETMNSVTKQMYPAIAKRRGTTASRVERAIRHAISRAWEQDKIRLCEGVYGKAYDEQTPKPTNSNFIILVSEKLRLSYDD